MVSAKVSKGSAKIREDVGEDGEVPRRSRRRSPSTSATMSVVLTREGNAKSDIYSSTEGMAARRQTRRVLADGCDDRARSVPDTENDAYSTAHEGKPPSSLPDRDRIADAPAPLLHTRRAAVFARRAVVVARRGRRESIAEGRERSQRMSATSRVALASRVAMAHTRASRASSVVP